MDAGFLDEQRHCMCEHCNACGLCTVQWFDVLLVLVSGRKFSIEGNISQIIGEM